MYILPFETTQSETVSFSLEHSAAEPWSSLHSPPQFAPELHAVLDTVLAREEPQLQHTVTTRPCKSDLLIRMSEPVLSRTLYAVLRGLRDARLAAGVPLSRLLISTRKCLNGYGAVVEFVDDGVALPRHLIFQLSQMEASPLRETSGWHLLIARDLAETHGGRLHVQSPPRGLKTGAALRLFLPLSTGPQSAAGSTDREVFHVVV